MGKDVKKLLKIVGVVAIGIATAGIGLAIATGATLASALGTTVVLAGSAVSLSTVMAAGAALFAIGSMPSLEQTIDRTGANARGQAFIDPNALGAYVFGRTTVPMALVYEQLHGTNEDRVSNVMAHAWHEIHQYVSLAVEGETVTFSGDQATGEWSGIVEWRRNRGNPGQTAIVFGGGVNWPSSATFAGVAHSALTWNFFADPDGDKLKSGVPTRVDIVVEGARLYDPRRDPAYGAGAQDFADPSTWAFNNGNAVLVLLRYLIGEYSASGELIWGRGASESDIDMASFVAMANVADELDPESGVPKFRLGGMHLLDGDFEAFVRRWEHETGGKLSKAGGVYRVWLPHDDLTPLTTITDDDLLAGIPVQHTVASGVENLFNTARGRYIEPTEGYRAFPYPEVSEPSAVTDDGGKRVLYHDFSWVQDVSVAQRIARIKVRRSRFQRLWTLALGWKGQGPNYRPFTVHTLRIKETGGDNQLVRVVDRRMRTDGVTILTLQQEDASIYDDTLPLGDPHASNTIPKRIDRLGTILPRVIRWGEIVRDPKFLEPFGVAWVDDGFGGVSIVAGGGEGGGNALQLQDLAVGTPRKAINQDRFDVAIGEFLTGSARLKRTDGISLLQIGANFYRSDTGAFVNSNFDIISLPREMPLPNTYYTIQFRIEAGIGVSLPDGVRLLAAIAIGMTPTGGETATVTVSEIHARRSSDAEDAAIASVVPVQSSAKFTGTKVLKETGAWEEPFRTTVIEVAAWATVINHEYPPGNVKRYGAAGDGITDDTAAIQAAINACNGVEVYFPPGVYRTTGTISTSKPKRTWLRGDVSTYFDSTGAVIKYEGTGIAFDVGVQDGNPDVTGKTLDFRMTNLAIEATSTGQTAVRISNTAFAELKRVKTRFFRGKVIDLAGGNVITRVHQCEISGAGDLAGNVLVNLGDYQFGNFVTYVHDNHIYSGHIGVRCTEGRYLEVARNVHEGIYGHVYKFETAGYIGHARFEKNYGELVRGKVFEGSAFTGVVLSLTVTDNEFWGSGNASFPNGPAGNLNKTRVVSHRVSGNMFVDAELNSAAFLGLPANTYYSSTSIWDDTTTVHKSQVNGAEQQDDIARYFTSHTEADLIAGAGMFSDTTGTAGSMTKTGGAPVGWTDAHTVGQWTLETSEVAGTFICTSQANTDIALANKTVSLTPVNRIRYFVMPFTYKYWAVIAVDNVPLFDPGASSPVPKSGVLWFQVPANASSFTISLRRGASGQAAGFAEMHVYEVGVADISETGFYGQSIVRAAFRSLKRGIY